ncbi:MAG: 3-hydroxybutyryl-CoA dehydrogenase, partial [uncultured Acidimicrobiales bacterium]
GAAQDRRHGRRCHGGGHRPGPGDRRVRGRLLRRERGRARGRACGCRRRPLRCPQRGRAGQADRCGGGRRPRPADLHRRRGAPARERRGGGGRPRAPRPQGHGVPGARRPLPAADDPRLELERLPHLSPGRRHRPPRPRDRLALGLPGAGDAAGRDRACTLDVGCDHRGRRRAGPGRRQEPGRRAGRTDLVGLRGQPRLLRHGARGGTGRARGHRRPRRGGPADGGLLPLADGTLRHDPGRGLRVERV